MPRFAKLTPEILYDRLLIFAKRCQKLVSRLPKTRYNLIYGDQLIRSSSSPGSNYIEAIEASSRKEFVHKLKTCRKESKESIHWLDLIQNANESLGWVKKETNDLTVEATEFVKIFTSSIITSEKNREINKFSK